MSADLVDRGSAPWSVTSEGLEVYHSAKQSKAISFGTDYASSHPDSLTELKYAGARWKVSGSHCPKIAVLDVVRINVSPGEYLGTQVRR